MTAQIDTAIAEQKSLRKQVFDALIKEENLEEGVAKYARAIDDAFMEVAHAELDDARKKGDFMRSGKVQKLLDTIEAMSKMPPEIEFLEQLVEKNDVAEITAMIDENKDKVNDAFKQLLETFIGQVKAIPEQKELLDKLELIQKIVAL
jgi:anaerobic glycerol-3-phosphate dehydrogenase